MLRAVPFRFKLFAIGAGVLLAALGALAAGQYLIVEDLLLRELRQRADDERPLLRAALTSPLIERDFAAVQAILRESATARGLAYLVLVDGAGRPIARAGDDVGGTPPKEGADLNAVSGDRLLAFELPIEAGGQKLARLHYGLSTRPMREASERIIARAAWVALACLVASVLLMELLHARLTRPLRGLARASQRVRAGDYDVELPPARGDDEIGRLTEDFRHMVAEIRRRIEAMTAAQADLRRLLDEAGVRERELAAARTAAEVASEAKSRFLAKVSHEIRTPLNGVLGMLELVQNDALEPGQLRRIELAYDSARHLLEIIEDVLDLSRIEQGRLRVECAPFDARALVSDLGDLFAPAARAKGLAFETTCGALPPALSGDAGLLRQVFANLVNNAIKFTKAGRIDIACWCDAAGLDGRALLHFRVQDTGIGIAPAALERLFAPFVQADDGNTRRYGGTGLGLSISRGLAESMQGEIVAASVQGEGSTFEARIPLAIAGEGVARPAAPEAGAGGAALRGRRVLVVEDNPVNRMVVEAMLANAGCTVLAASCGSDALSLAATAELDAVLLDLQLPDIDGFDVAERLRAGWRSRGQAGAPFVAFTANAFDEDRERCVERGIGIFVAKPCTQAELTAALAHAVASVEPATGGR